MLHKLEIPERESGCSLSSLQRRIITEISKIKNIYYEKNNFNFDRIHISTSLYNILSDSNSFHTLKDIMGPDVENELSPVGVISGMHVYIDFSIRRNQMRLSIDKNQIRNMKINAIFDKDKSEKTFEAFIEINSDLI